MTSLILVGDCRESMRVLPAQSVNTCVTSPPYFGLRDYDHGGQIGLEPTPAEFVTALVEVFREVRRVLRDDGTVWLNLGDSHAGGGSGARDAERWPKQQRNNTGNVTHSKTRTGLKSKNLIGIPWRVAFALQDDGWYLRQDIIWAKPNPMPESVKDRCTKAHEYIFLLSKGPRYYFNRLAIEEPADPKNHRLTRTTRRAHAGQSPDAGFKNGRQYTTRNKRDVWTVPTHNYKGAHFATFPPDLIRPCVLAGAPVGGVVLDPFGGAGTTGLVAEAHERHSYLMELNPEYAALAAARIGPAALVVT